MKYNKRTGRLFYKLVTAILLSTFILSPLSVVADTIIPSDISTPTATQSPDVTTPAPSPSITPSSNSAAIIPDTSTSQQPIPAAALSSTTAPSTPAIKTMAASMAVAPAQTTDAPQLSPTSQSKLIPKVNDNTGALQYSYPITLPPGRNGMTPNISLQYNSQNTTNDSIIGYGWNLSIPYIQRENKHGVDNLYTGTYNDFTTSDKGEIAQISGSTYGLRTDDGSFSKYIISSNAWTVTTKAGLTYTYGTTATSRQDDAGNTSNVYKWMLDKVTDTNGNSISYSYFKDQGQIYPDTITYTNTSGGTGPFTVTFGRETATNTTSSGYVSGFNLTTQYRINAITVAISGTTRHKYVLAYTLSDNNTRSMLNIVTESGYDPSGTVKSYPSVKMTYTTSGSKTFTKNTAYAMPTHTLSSGTLRQDARLGDSGDNAYIFPGAKTGTMIDINGDGYPDWLETENSVYQSGSSTNGKFYDVWLGSTSGWTLNTAWTSAMPIDSSGHQYQLSDYQNNRLMDVNGDGLPDWIITTSGPTPNANTAAVWLNTGTGWTKSITWVMPTIVVAGTTYGIAIGASSIVVNGVGSNIAPTGYSYYTNLIDINNDGLPDLVVTTTDNVGTGSISDHYGVWLNTGTGWTKSTTWSMPVHPIGTGTNTGSYVSQQDVNRIIDVNGDGLPDWVETIYSATSNENYDVWLNTGTGWVRSTTWTLPVHTNTLPAHTVTSQGVTLPSGQIICNADIGGSFVCATRTDALYDINGDGLPDFIETVDTAAYTEYHVVWLNNGKNGWIKNTSWVMAFYPYPNTTKPMRLGNDGQFSSQLADINNDGLVDWISSNNNGTGSPPTPSTLINTGSGWTQPGAIQPSHTDSINDTGSILGFTDYTHGLNTPVTFHRTMALQDVNNDGSPDWIESNQFDTPLGTTVVDASEHFDVWTDSVAQSDLLSGITYDHGASSSFIYAPQTIVDKNASTQTQTIEAVTSSTLQDGQGVSGTSYYRYTNGKYFYSTNKTLRKFAGFQKVTTINPDGSQKIDYYHQGNSIDTASYEYSDDEYQIGELYRTDITDTSNNLYKRTTTEWTTFPITSVNSNVAFVYPNQTITEDFDGNSTERAVADTLSYNTATGNLTTDTNYGEVTATSPIAYTDIGTDKATTSYTYATNGTGIYLVSDQTTIDQSSNKISETQHYYDNAALGTLTLGNETKTSIWKTGTTYISTQKTYNSNGTIATSTDGRGYITTNTAYDTYNVYPITVTDPLSHVTHYTYDYMFGVVIQTTDLNNDIYITNYDGMGRILNVQIPDPSTGSTTYKASYGYTDIATGVSIKETSAYTTTGLQYYIEDYYDGLGRLVEEKRQTDPNNVWSNYQTKDYWYDASGRLIKQSLPYIDYAGNYDKGVGSTTLNTAYTYDPEGRVLTAVNNLGTMTNTYDQWKTTTTDPNSNINGYYHDAYGNLVQVNEINSGTTYSTYYTWDLNKDLTKMTDASGNVRNFTYDGLGNRLTAQDLHVSTDTTFGTWTYTYDNDNYLTQSISPNAATVNYTYDAGGRKLTEDYTGATGTEITYAYDTCTQGIGKLCSVTMTAGANTVYTYDYNGNLSSENKTINGSSYLTSYTYNRGGDTVTITYPDSSTVQYNYLSDHLVSSVNRKESGGSYTSVINSVSYSPDLKVATIAYANGVTTTNTYDPAKLYRLTNKQTQNSGGTNLQNIAYTYDTDGNITNLADTSATDAAKNITYTYDNLNRLLSATGYGGTWYNPSWLYRLKISSVASKVLEDTGDVYIDLSLLPANFFTNAKSDGSDIRVTKSDGTTEVAIEVKNYNATTKTGELYLSTGGSLSTSANTDFYIYYGNASAAAYSLSATYGAQHVYDVSTKGVWHLDENTATVGGIKDSTANGLNGTMYSNGVASAIGSSAGKLGNAPTFDGINDTLDVPDNSALESNTYTIEAWVNLNALPSTRGENSNLVTKKNTVAPWGSYALYIANPNNGVAANFKNTAGTAYVVGTSTPIPTATWEYAVTREDASLGSNNLTVRTNASSASTTPTTTSGTLFNSNDAFRIGADYSGGDRLSGQIDEMRYHSVALSDNYITTRYNDMGSPSTFWTIGTQQTPTGGANIAYTYDALGNIATGSLGTYLYQGNTGTLKANPDAATSIGGTTYTYDADGNLTGNGTTTSVWNYKDQITQTTNSSGTFPYAYDQDGNRVMYNTNIYPNKYYSYDGSTKKKQIFIGDELVATIQTQSSTVTPFYVQTDNILGTNLVTDSTGTRNILLDYYPFGDLRLDEEATSFVEKNEFGGHPYDYNTTRSYLGARYYEPKIGRFISEDPTTTFSPEGLLTDPQQLNTYSYARNNPLTNIDPDGKLSINVFGVLPQSTQISIGNSTNNAYQNNSFARAALDHPYAPAIAGSIPLAAYGAVAGITALSVEYLGGAGTACVAFCDKGAQEVQSGFQTLGKLGEAASGLDKNTERIGSATNTASYRIPDGLDHANQILSEVKNVKYQPLTNQIKDFSSYTQSNGYKFELYTRSNTQLSGPLQNMVNSGDIIHKILNLK